MSELFGRLRNRWGLLVLLAAALLGFLLLINLLGTLTSSGPEDLLATNPSEERHVSLPSGSGLLAFAIGVTGLILGIVAIVGSVCLARREDPGQLRRYLVGGSVVAFALAGVGLYLAFSGILGQEVAYSEHKALRPYVEPMGLAVLGAFFLTLVLVGAFKPKLLLLHLAIWLVLALIFGFFTSNSLAGLNLFDETEEAILDGAYAAEVERYREPKSAVEDIDAVHWDSTFTMGDGNSAFVRDSSLLMLPGTSAEPRQGGSPRPLFTVSGAEHTSRLRSATGDVYRDGEWLQLDPISLDSEAWDDLPREILDMIDQGILDEALIEQGLDDLASSERSIPDLLAQPSATPESLEIDHITVAPAEGFESLEPGTLPIAANPLGVRDEGSYSPFSQTFQSHDPVSEYEWRSMALEFTQEALEQADASDDPTYLQLPADLPPRVHDLAGEITQGIDSPYEKAQAIEQFLESEYTYRVGPPGQEAPLVPEGQDPVDWFLFDEKAGSSTSFSSAFTILSRASGVPARVVSGWAISPTDETQTVHSDQAHQWTEIALKEFGWIPYDPTPGGAPERVDARNPLPAGASFPRQEGDDAGIQKGAQGTGMGPGGGSGTPPDPDLLGEIREETAIENLANALNPEVREQAAEVLGEIGSDRAVEALADAMFNDPEESVREASTESMTSLEFEHLAQILQEHPDPLLRRAAAICLGRKGDPRALSPLGNSLVYTPDSEEDVREAAASALGDLLMPEAVEPLSKALESDGSTKVRKAGAGALGALGQGRGAGSLEQALANDSEKDVREAAADALGELLEASSLPVLLEGEANDPSPVVRGACSRAIGRFRQSGLEQALEGSDNPSVRAAAAQVLGDQGNSSAADDLIEALSDPSAKVQEAAQGAVNNLGIVTSLESGAGLLSHDAGTSMIPGTSSGQAAELPHMPVFEVSGAVGIDFLRIAVGDSYVNGQWQTDGQTGRQYSAGSPVPDLGPVAQVTTRPSRTQTSQVTVSSTAGEKWILEGHVPISSQPQGISMDGILFLESETFSGSGRVKSYTWTASAPVYSRSELERARVSAIYHHTALPPGVPDRVRALALRITSGHASPYRKAKAIEQYLRENYTYRLADPSGGGVPQGHDPVDWFLFESREGTCGNFSSAFVILARAVGLPARVVSGWSIAPTGDTQTVYSDQAHQRAEVAFDGMGWVPFEPTASSGAPARAQSDTQGRSGSQQQREEIEQLVEQLSSDDPGIQQSAQQALEEVGAEITITENGGAVVTSDGESYGIGVGTTTQQVEQPGSGPGGGAPEGRAVFFVSGAAHTRYLRSSAGDLYMDGTWQQLDQVSLDYVANQSVLHLIRNEIAGNDANLAPLSSGQTTPGLLTGFDVDPPITYTDRIVIEAAPGLGNLPAGVVPTSQFLAEVDSDGQFHPVSGTFSLDVSTESFSWVSRVPQFTSAQLESAPVASGSIYTALPEDLPRRIRELALEVTSGHGSPYAKASALESYLSRNYTYRFADGSGSEVPPPGRDPVDWFLFDHREGTCGVFSTAFVVMARSIGIPARVAAGWAIDSTGERQEVRTNQAHQWAEVAFEGLGWVQFEPTTPLGPQSRTEQAREEPPQEQQASEDRESPSVEEQTRQDEPIDETRPQEASEEEETTVVSQVTREFEQPVLQVNTETVITTWTERIRRRKPFTIGGTVRTDDGRPVAGVQVEIFVNDTKEHGGILIGETIAQNGRFMAEVTVPSSLERGNYQLLAHTVANDQYEESWSDPDITVYSESGLQLTGPSEVPVDTQALFRGKILDDTGSGVAEMEVQVLVDGREQPPLSTAVGGEFAFSQTFSEVGPHTVEIGFEGKDFLLGNTARLEVAAVMPTDLTINVPGDASVGEEFNIRGFLRNGRGEPLSQAELTLAVGGGPSWTTATDGDGRFATTGTIDAVGHSLVRVEFAGDYPVLPTDESSSVTARHLTNMSISGPSSVLQGEEAVFAGRINSGTTSETGSLSVIIEDGNGRRIGSATTEEDGSYEFQTAGFDEVGPRTLVARFREQDELTSSSAGFALDVVAPTVLTIEGPTLVGVQDTVALTGMLTTSDGESVPSARIWIGDPGSLPLLTGHDGTFAREVPLFAELGENQTEATRNIAFGFEGTDRLAPALGSHSVTVGLPWLSVEPTEPVARGENANLRGILLLGSRPIPDALVTTPSGAEAVTNSTGAFALRYPVAPDASLGRQEIPVAVDAFALNATVPVDVKSAVSLVVVPLEEVRPGAEVLVQATLLDDEERGITGARIFSSQGKQSLTDDSGVAQMVVEVPDNPNILTTRVGFTYEGDGNHLPLDYRASIAITQASFNWLLFVGLPAIIIAILLSGYMARRLGPALLSGSRRPVGREDEGTVGVATLPGLGEAGLDEPDPEPLPEPEATLLALSLEPPTPDLPAVWGVGEEVTVQVNLSVEDGPGLANSQVELEIPGGERVTLQTDETGRCSYTWQADVPGDHEFTVEFAESDLYLSSTASVPFRVVSFRGEIVRLYNDFAAWTGERIRGTTGRTPRELEALLSTSAEPLDFRAVDEIISRFEEADYSEHEIGRRQYESMYRSWHSVLGPSLAEQSATGGSGSEEQELE